MKELYLPKFSTIDPAKIEPEVNRLLTENRARIEHLLVTTPSPSWDNFVMPLDNMEERFSRFWSPVRHLEGVMNSPELRKAYAACVTKVAAYYADFLQNKRVWAAFKSIAASPGFASLSREQRRAVELQLRAFKLGGIELEGEKAERYKKIVERLAELGTKFNDNVLDATDAWKKHITDEAMLDGVPETKKGVLRAAAAKENLDGWLVTLARSSYETILRHAANRALRAEVYEAYQTRASDRGPHDKKFDNTAILEELLALKYELARLLGFENFAEYSLATKMAPSVQGVFSFLRDLARRARPKARREYAALAKLAAADGVAKVEAWDALYYGERLREKRYAFSDEEVRQYFPLPKTLSGLWAVTERLYGVAVSEVFGIDVWHPDVRFFELRAGGEVIGGLYVDLYSRLGRKRGGAWMDEAVTRWRMPSGIQRPVAYLNCNFEEPHDGKPSLLTHDDLTTLFHEFGHCLNHLLTEAEVRDVSGLNGVEWDAVELPSQFFENWGWEEETLTNDLSGHWQTGAPLPKKLITKMRRARTFSSGLATVQQLIYSLYDFRLHAEYAPGDAEQIVRRWHEVAADVGVIPEHSSDRKMHSFGHIFGGGYDAGYYSYKWAEMLSADAFAAFREAGIFDRATADRFRKEILASGGSRPAMESFIAFRGREPTIEALLKQDGLIK